MNPARTRNPISWIRFTHRNEIPVSVLHLAAFLQGAVIGRFDPDEYGFETCPDHLPHQPLIVGEIDRCLRREIEGVSSPFHPVDHCGQNVCLQFLLVADEIVIHEKDAASPSGVMERFQFPDYLVRALGARAVAVEGRDVAELAAKGTTARILEVHGEISSHLDEVPERGRCRAEVRECVGLVDVRPLLPSPGPRGTPGVVSASPSTR